MCERKFMGCEEYSCFQKRKRRKMGVRDCDLWKALFAYANGDIRILEK